MADLKTLIDPSSERMGDAVEEVLRAGNHVLLLFDDGLDEVHDRFLREYLVARSRHPPFDFLVYLRGDEMRSAEEFYTQCRTAIHLADYMGSNLDALQDVLRGEALSPDRGRRTLWVWRRVDVLYANDREFFESAFDAALDCARQVSKGFLAQPGRQLVSVLLTGRWAVLREAASNKDSFVYRFQEFLKPAFPDLSTHVVSVRITHQ